MSFKKNKYKILKKVLSRKLVNFIYDYFLNKRSAAKFLFCLWGCCHGYFVRRIAF